MKRITQIAAVFSLMAACSFQASAQWGPPDFDPQKRAERQTTLMVDSLGLSTKQAEKVKEVNETYAKKHQEMREQNQQGDWEANREKMMALRQEHDAELQKVMTTEQWEKWLKVRENERGKRGGPGGRKGKPKPQKQGR